MSSTCNHCHTDEKPGHGHDHTHAAWSDSRKDLLLVILSGTLIALGMVLKWTLHPAQSILTLIYAAATLAGAILVVPHAVESLRKLRLDINILMTVAVTGAWILGEKLEAASVVFLFSLSELLESWASDRARRSVKALLDLTPETARLINPADRSETEIPVDQVPVDSLILIRSGERIPLDGRILTGTSSIDQAPITGESVPVDKTPGDPVFAGTINGNGSLTIQVTRPSTDTTLSRIIRLVGDAESQRPPTQRFVDKFASIYTPIVFLIALLIAILPPILLSQPWQPWIYRSLVLLVIACPCALVIATPVSIVSGITALARRGVLVKGGIHLESVGKLRALAVDKTGTITQGRPQVVDIIPLGHLSPDEILIRAAAIDTHSTHPLAQAVVEAARQRNLPFNPASDYTNITGRGATAVIDGHPHFIGNHRLTHETGLCSPEIEARLATIEAKGQSLAVIGHNPHPDCPGELLGIIAIADRIRPEVPAALRKLHDAGLQKVIMLSGDNQRTATAIASEARIDQAIGDLLPEDKVTRIKELLSQYHHVGMIGDGVNDAPALALATIGIAMGGIGSDTAIETADITLMKDDLTKVADAIHTGRRTLGIIRFNIAFALIIKALFLLLALLGHTSLWLAILADTGATLLVILNALRLLRIPPQTGA